MESDPRDDRLASIEATLAHISTRLFALESRFALKPPVIPAAVPAPAQPIYVPTTSVPMPEVSRPVPAPPKDADAIEYAVGVNGLLRGGAVVVLCALLFLAALMIGRGMVTPPVQFAGEIALCLTFIGIGLFKRNEREDFGQLMVGLGAFGLYASFAGAHAYKHLITAETLIVLAVGLSLANLGFATWRASKTFWGIGLIGGLAAAQLPMQRDLVASTLRLHFLILIPAALVVLRNKWSELAVVMWLASSLALWPATSSDYSQIARVGATYLNCAIAVYTYGKLFKRWALDDGAFLTWLMLLGTGLYAIGIDQGHRGSLHSLALTAIGLVLGWVLRADRTVRNAIWAGALITFVVTTPMGLTQTGGAWAYGVEALLLSFIAIRYHMPLLRALAGVAWGLSMIAYLYFADQEAISFAPMSAGLEAAFLGLSAVTILAAMKSFFKDEDEMLREGGLFASATVLLFYAMRAFHLGVAYRLSLNAADSMLLSGGLFVVGISTAAWVTRSRGLLVFSLGLAGLTSFFTLIIEPSAKAQWILVSLHGFSAFGLVLGTLMVRRNQDRQLPIYAFGAGLLLSLHGIQLARTFASATPLGLGDEGLVVATISLLSVLWGVLAARSRDTVFLTLSWIACFVTSISCFRPWTNAPQWLFFVTHLAALSSLVTHYIITPRKKTDEWLVGGVSAFTAWAVGSHFVATLLQDPPFEMKLVAAVTVSFVVVAFSYLVAGFIAGRRHLRYWGLGVVGVTVVKVFLVDLSELDSLIRVGVLMLLGLVMVGGGYGYIRWRKTATPIEE